LVSFGVSGVDVSVPVTGRLKRQVAHVRVAQKTEIVLEAAV
jgi:hypothetical protein